MSNYDNFKISKKEFLDALTVSSRAISSTTPLPSLSGIKISATEDSLILVSSDSNISIKTSINNNDTSTLIITEPGEIVLDARYLLEMVRKIDSEFINVEIIDGTFVRIYSGKSEYKINGITLFISKGIGCVRLPMRLKAVPEVNIIEI